MTLMIFKFCFLFNFISPNLKCVTSTEAAKQVLSKQTVKEILWYPDFLEDTKEFQLFLKYYHPVTKLTGIDLWSESTDFKGCGWYL